MSTNKKISELTKATFIDEAIKSSSDKKWAYPYTIADKVAANICDEVKCDDLPEEAVDPIEFLEPAANPEPPMMVSFKMPGQPYPKAKMPKRQQDPSFNSASSYYKPEYLEKSESEISKKDLELVRSSLEIKEIDSVTMVTCIVLDKERENEIIAMRCVGQPLGGYIYDNAQDAYLVSGCAWFDLGQFSFALKLTVPGSGEWSQKIPIPISVLENHFSPAQRKIVEEKKKKYPSPRYEIKYIQMVS